MKKTFNKTELYTVIGELLADGYTHKEIVRELNNRGFTTVTGLPISFTTASKYIAEARKGKYLTTSTALTGTESYSPLVDMSLWGEIIHSNMSAEAKTRVMQAFFR